MNKKVKFAVVGCGHIGKRHAKMIQENKSAELVALVDIQDKNNLSIQEFNVPFFKTIKELIESQI
jgi:predicted dehydrogenase